MSIPTTCGNVVVVSQKPLKNGMARPEKVLRLSLQPHFEDTKDFWASFIARNFLIRTYSTGETHFSLGISRNNGEQNDQTRLATGIVAGCTAGCRAWRSARCREELSAAPKEAAPRTYASRMKRTTSSTACESHMASPTTRGPSPSVTSRALGNSSAARRASSKARWLPSSLRHTSTGPR